MEKDLKKECERFGEIESIRILRKKNCAFVNFITVKQATAALNALHSKKLGDTVIKVNYGKVSVIHIANRNLNVCQAIPAKDGAPVPVVPVPKAKPAAVLILFPNLLFIHNRFKGIK